MAEAVEEGKTDPEYLLDRMHQTDTFPDADIPDTGVGLEMERALSAMFIKMDGYGSRSSTVLLVDRDNRFCFTERQYHLGEWEGGDRTFQFEVEK